MVSGFYPTDAALLELATSIAKGGKEEGMAGVLPLNLPSFHVYGMGDDLVPMEFSAALHSLQPRQEVGGGDGGSSQLSYPHRRRMSLGIPLANSPPPPPPSPSGGGGGGGDSGDDGADVTCLFSPSLASVAVHNGGHFVPTDASVRKAFRAFIASAAAGYGNNDGEQDSQQEIGGADEQGVCRSREAGAAKKKGGQKGHEEAAAAAAAAAAAQRKER